MVPARAITAGFAREGAKRITIANRTVQNARDLARFANNIGIEADAVSIKTCDPSRYRFVINATSIGLQDEATPIDTEKISRESIVYDIIYAPMNTDLVKKSRERGATVILGYEMLLGQAVRAFEIWHQKKHRVMR